MRSNKMPRSISFSRWFFRLTLLSLSFILVACGEGTTQSGNKSVTKLAAVTTTASFEIVSLSKVSEVRVGRTTFDYEFRVLGRNLAQAGSPAWTASILTVGPGIEVRSGSLSFPSTPLGEQKTSLNTITLRVDRSFPFASSSIVWKFETTTTAPPPLAGTDADADGVRDDVQAFVSSTYGAEPGVASALLKFARGLQQSALSNTAAAIESANILRMNASMCLVDRVGAVRARQVTARVRSIQLNTVERIRAEYMFRSALSGTVRTWDPPALNGSCES